MRAAGWCTKIIQVEIAELVGKAFAQAVGGISLDKPCVGHKANHAALAHTVARPADCADVAVVKRALEVMVMLS